MSREAINIINAINDMVPGITFRVQQLGSQHSDIPNLSRNRAEVSADELIRILPSLMADSQARCLNLFFRPNDPRFVFLDIDRMNAPRWVSILREFMDRGTGYWGTARPFYERILPFLIVNSSKSGNTTNNNVWFYCPQIRDWDEYTVVAKYLAARFDGDHGSAQQKQIGRMPNSTNYKRATPERTSVVMFRPQQRLRLDSREWKNPLTAHRQANTDAHRKKAMERHDRRHRNLHRKGVHTHAHKHPHLYYDHRDDEVRQSQLTAVPSQVSISHRSHARPNSGSGSSEEVSSTQSGRSEFAFVSMVRERDPSKSRSDLVNILRSQSQSSMASINRTVDAVLARSQDNRSSSWSYDSVGMVKYLKKNKK